MTCIRFMALLFFLFLDKVNSKDPEPTFRAEGGIVEMGYCFGADYIVVYRSAPEGDQLLGNSSNNNMPNTPPSDLKGRIHINEDPNLLGLQISNLTHLDSGIYRRECWQNQTQTSHHTQLTVCKEKMKSEDIIENTKGGGTELRCKSSAIGSAGTSVQWYYEMYPSYQTVLLLDSSVSLTPLVNEFTGVVDVRDDGALLVFNYNALQGNPYFYCLVIKDMTCLSFQNLHPQDHSESKEIFVSLGDRVFLDCPADGNDQQWETPLGKIDGDSIKDNQMYISADDFSLIIPATTDNHIGEYSCISSSLEVLYLLVLCPRNTPQEKVVYKGDTASLKCNCSQDLFRRVQWHRYRLLGQYEIIHDSEDKTIPVPEDLQGRVTLSENGSSLTISDLKMKDRGEYGCVVSKPSEFLLKYDDYEDYDENVTEEDEFTNGDWLDTASCVFKQVIILNISMNRSVTTDTTAAPSAGFNITACAVGAGLVGLLVVGAIISLVVIKRARTKEEATSNINLDRDPGCTEVLTPSE